MWANLSFDWRKCQFLFAISGINVVYGLYVVTRGVPLIDTLSLAADSLPVSARELSAFLSTPFLFCRRLKTVNILLFSV